MDDAVHEAEHRGGHQQPATPQQQAGAHPVGAGGPSGQPQSGDKADQRGGQQPGRLGAHRHAEHPADAGIAAEEQVAHACGTRHRNRRRAADRRCGRRHRVPPRRAPAEARCSPAPTAARLLSVEPPMYGRESAGHRLTSARYQPPEAMSRGRADHQLPDPLPQPDGRGDQEGQRQTGRHQKCLKQLGEEREADRATGQRHPLRARRLDGPHDAVRCRDQQQHQQRVGVVEPEHQRRHGRQRERGAGDQSGTGSAAPVALRRTTARPHLPP